MHNFFVIFLWVINNYPTALNMKTQGDRECIAKMPSLRGACRNIFANTFCVCFMNYWKISHWILWQIILSSCYSCPWKNLKILIYYKVHYKENILNCWKETFKQLEPPFQLACHRSLFPPRKVKLDPGWSKFWQVYGVHLKRQQQDWFTNGSFISRLTEHILSIMKEM